jgi:hypothetical protein
MIKTFVTTVGISALLATTAVADLVKKQSPHSVQMTMDKLEAAVGKAGAGVAARVWRRGCGGAGRSCSGSEIR